MEYMVKLEKCKNDIRKAIQCLQNMKLSHPWRPTSYSMPETEATDLGIISLKATLASLDNPDTVHGVNYIIFRAMQDIEFNKHLHSHDFYPAFDECTKILSELVGLHKNDVTFKQEEVSLKLSAEDFMSIINANLDDLISKSQKAIDSSEEHKDKYEHTVFKTYLEFTQKFTNELYSKITEGGK